MRKPVPLGGGGNLVLAAVEGASILSWPQR